MMKSPDFLRSLRSGDAFDVSLAPVMDSRIRLAFEQSIVNADSGEEMLRARIITTAVNARGRPYLPTALQALLD